MSILTVAHVLLCFFLILIILLQQGKGADVGATFGGGGNTLFGASGADTILTKVTAFLAFGFMISSIWLAVQAKGGLAGTGKLFEVVPDEAPVSLLDVAPPTGVTETTEATDEAGAEETPAAPAEAPVAAAPAPTDGEAETNPAAAPAAEAAAPTPSTDTPTPSADTPPEAPTSETP